MQIWRIILYEMYHAYDEARVQLTPKRKHGRDFWIEDILLCMYGGLHRKGLDVKRTSRQREVSHNFGLWHGYLRFTVGGGFPENS